MELRPGNFCPLIKEDCVGIKCVFFTQIQGKHPNTGVDVNEWGCAVAWLPVLMIENSLMQRQTGAAIDKLNKNVVNQSLQTQALLITKNENIDKLDFIDAVVTE
jgi:hypothetical protein